MVSYTRYLAAAAEAVNEVAVQSFDSSPIAFAQGAIRDSREIRYSPVMPAFLTRGEGPPPVPASLESVTFLFANTPYKALGNLKGDLSALERSNVYFTEGLASIVLLNFTRERTLELRVIADDCPLECWPLTGGKLSVHNIFIELPHSQRPHAPIDIDLPSTDNAELRVYVEQISASLASLWSSYRIYFPAERETLRQIAAHVNNLTQLHGRVQMSRTISDNTLSRLKDANAITAALVEISAALSYAVTQGTSGSFPILSNRSPFPHHSLLGIGGAVRAITKYTRYLEWAFMTRSASKVICDQYSIIEHIVPARISEYSSGPEYRLSNSPDSHVETFDVGDDCRQEDQLPLIAHFSLRHGFMESKYSVTAASEALTAETLPQWTLMTLSHEVMHSRVRTIFQALFGKTWEGDDSNLISNIHFEEFSKWFQARKNPQNSKVDSGLRNIILYFCYALDKCTHPVPEADHYAPSVLTLNHLSELYCRHKHLAIETLVHFHDYYFVYACQPKIYIRSIWASWVRVAGPYVRPREYLTRSLATVACGTGLKPSAAFTYAKDILLDGLFALEAVGVNSPLFSELRRLTSAPAESMARAHFDPYYYLIDSVRRYFASRTIASKIDRLDSDPFSEGSTSVDDYTANVYVYGEGHVVSPIRYSLATLFKALSGERQLEDLQWLSAWNFIVLSS